jgi:hypothetical protein
MQAHAFTDRRTAAREETLAEANVLVIPGWNGSGAGHWQTHWEFEYPNFRRVEQRNWTRPSRTEWIEQIDEEVDSDDSPVILVAHSLGCLAVAHWAVWAGAKLNCVAGAFLVAPPWVTESEQCPRELHGFLPMPVRPLPFPSLFVASENDAYLPMELATRLASAWGSQFINIGRQGHINIASGHGPWPQGERLLADFANQVAD